MPKMVARMLQYLDIHGGERVLEIGTGTGWNAALLAYRLGADRVTTIEIDPRIAAHAHARLAAAGYSDVVNLAGNGSLGHAAMAPYHRVISTAACQQVPYAWVRQCCPGGRVLTPWGTPYCNFGLLSLTVGEDGTATGQLVDTANFMWLRDQRVRFEPIRPTDAAEQMAEVSWTELHPADVRHTEQARGVMIAIGVLVPGCRSSYTSPADDPDGDGVLWLADHTTNSWARLEHKPGAPGPYKVVQLGPRRLWNEVEAAHQWWVEQGSPGAERWLFTVTPKGQQIELD
jgi:protein-L-isoaspartate O-methyltransferase